MTLTAAEQENGIWPIDPDPAATNLPARQFWSFAEDGARSVEAGGARLSAQDARLPFLGIRRNARGRAYPAAFAFCLETGARLPLPSAPSDGPETLEIEPDRSEEIALTDGVPALFQAGRPEVLYLFQQNLGALEWRDPAGRGWIGMGRLPPAGLPSWSHALAATPDGLAYATGDALVVVPLPQLGPDLDRATFDRPGLRFLGAPAWIPGGLVVPASRDGRLVLCRLPMRGAVPSGPAAFDDLGGADEAAFARPVANRLGDWIWPGATGFLSCPAGPERTTLHPWTEGFEPFLAQVPYRDGSGVFHQLGMREGRYHYAALDRTGALHRLNGPHLAAGTMSYSAAERFSTPWTEPAEALNLGAYGGSLLVPLLSLPRDTVLLAVRIDGGLGDFIRGRPLRRSATGYVLHHAHGAGLHRLPVSLEVSAIDDAAAFLWDGALHLYSRAERRCHRLPLRAR